MIFELKINFRYYDGVSLLCKFGLRKGLNLAKIDGSGDTPLHLAARTGVARIVEILLSSGLYLDMGQTNSGGFLPIEVRNTFLILIIMLLKLILLFKGSFYEVNNTIKTQVTESDEVISLLLKDPRFMPTSNMILRTGNTLLSRLCSVEPDTEDLFAKADSLFMARYLSDHG